jgi:hypothetical protein
MSTKPSYFKLKAGDQQEIIAKAAEETRRAESVVEKDIWLCLVLEQLFGMPGAKAMAFKGGTSLSKVYGAISRFSEDVDVTIDYRNFAPDTTLQDFKSLSGNQRKKQGEALKNSVAAYVSEVLKPYLEAQFATLVDGVCEVEISGDEGEEMRIHYPTRVRNPGGYLKEYVLVEFGGRNIIDPNAVHTIRPEIADLFPNVLFPSAQVTVLAGERTFWEKVTLIHAACNKPFPDGLNRNSRHWYDLAMLAEHDCGIRAKTDIALLEDVVELKSVFFNHSTANYDWCLQGALNLIPTGTNLDLLHADYNAMIAAGMLNGHELPMDRILGVLEGLQLEINADSTARNAQAVGMV